MVEGGHLHVASALVGANGSGEGVNISGQRIGQSLSRCDGLVECVVGFAFCHGITRTAEGDSLLCISQSSCQGSLYFGDGFGLNAVLDVFHGGIDTSDECIVVAHAQLSSLSLSYSIVEGKNLGLAGLNRRSYLAGRANLELAIGEELSCVTGIVSICHSELEGGVNRFARIDGEATATATNTFNVEVVVSTSLGSESVEGRFFPSHIAFSIHRTTIDHHSGGDVKVTTRVVACSISYHELGEFVAGQLHLQVMGHFSFPTRLPLRVEEGSGVAIQQGFISTFTRCSFLCVGVELVSAGDIVGVLSVASNVALHILSSGNGGIQFSGLGQLGRHFINRRGLLYGEPRCTIVLLPTRQRVGFINVQPTITRRRAFISISARGAVERGVAIVVSLGVDRSVFLSYSCRSLAVASRAEIQASTYVLNFVLTFCFSLNELPSEAGLVVRGNVGQGDEDALCTHLSAIERDVTRVTVVASVIEHKTGHGFGIGLGIGLRYGELCLGVGGYGGEVELASLLACVGAIRVVSTYRKLDILSIAFPNGKTILLVNGDSAFRGSNLAPLLQTLG